MITEEKLDEIFSLAEEMSKKDFIKLIQCLDDVYFNYGADEAMPDVYYDQLKEIYTKRFGKWKDVGAKIKSKDKVKLEHYMGSMDKISLGDQNVEKELKKWIAKYSGPYIVEDKLDGVSALLMYYPKGKMSLSTRGDGTHGENKSYLLNYLNVPEIYSDKKLAVRGELIMSKKNFKHFKSEYANSRNLVAGQVNRKENNVNPDILGKIDFVVFEIIEPRMKFDEQVKQIADYGFNCVNYKYPVRDLTIKKLNNLIDKMRKESAYEMDGVVVYDSSKVYPSNKSGNPKYAFAFKTLSETAAVKVKKVIWTISKYGMLKPKVELTKPERLSGVNIRTVTAHNAKKIVDDKIGPGTVLEITRSGDVIPKIIRTITSTEPQMPDVPYKWNATKVDLIYTGDEKTGQDQKQITNFFKELKAKGISEKTIQKLYQNNYNSIHKIVIITQKNLENAGFGPKQSENIYKAIQKSTKDVDLAKLMGASSIFGQGLGSRNSQLILDKYPNILEKKGGKNLVEEINQIEGFAKIRAEQFVKNLSEFKKFLKDNPKITYQIKKIKLSGKLAGKKYVFTGFRDDDLQDRIEGLGGKVSNSVSKDTTYVIASNVSEKKGKVLKAEKLGIKVISKENFLKTL